MIEIYTVDEGYDITACRVFTVINVRVKIAVHPSEKYHTLSTSMNCINSRHRTTQNIHIN